MRNFLKYRVYLSIVLVFTLVSCSNSHENTVTKQPITTEKTAIPVITPDASQTSPIDKQLTWYPRPHSQFKIPTGVQYLIDSTFVDPLHGWYLTLTENNGTELFKTENGGELWRKVAGSKSETNDNLFPKNGTQSLSFLNTQVGWLLGEFTEEDYARFWIYVTNDGGVTWQRDVLPPAFDIKKDTTTTTIESSKLWFFNENDGVLLVRVAEQDAKNQWLYFTHDSGKTWIDPQIVGNGIWKGSSGNIEWDFSNSINYSIVINQDKWETVDDYHEIWEKK